MFLLLLIPVDSLKTLSYLPLQIQAPENATSLWPIPYEKSPDQLPIISVNYVPPSDPYPEITKVLSQLENARESKKGTFIASLDASFKKAQKIVDKAVNSLISTWSLLEQGNSTSFAFVPLMSSMTSNLLNRPIVNPGLASFIPEQQVRVKTLPSPPLGGLSRIIRKIKILEKSKSFGEAFFFKLAKNELVKAANWWANQFKRESQKKCAKLNLVARASSFIVESPSKISPILNLRLGIKSGAYFPRVYSLVEDMQNRRDIIEQNEREAVIELTRQLFTFGEKKLRKFLWGQGSLNKLGQQNGQIKTGISRHEQELKQSDILRAISSQSFLEVPTNPGLGMTLRQRAFNITDIELDVRGPEDDPADILASIDNLAKTERTVSRMITREYSQQLKDIRTVALENIREIFCPSS